MKRIITSRSSGGNHGRPHRCYFANAALPPTCLISSRWTLTDLARKQYRRRLDCTRRENRSPQPSSTSLANSSRSQPFEDDLRTSPKSTGIIEPWSSTLDLNRALRSKSTRSASPATIITTNTSGLPVSKIAEGFCVFSDSGAHVSATHSSIRPLHAPLELVSPTPDSDHTLIAVRALLRLPGQGRKCSLRTLPLHRQSHRDVLGLNVMPSCRKWTSPRRRDALTGNSSAGPNRDFPHLDLVGLRHAQPCIRNMTANFARAQRTPSFPDFYGN